MVCLDSKFDSGGVHADPEESTYGIYPPRGQKPQPSMRGPSLGLRVYCRAPRDLCDFVRSFASGFIFTTALPPAIAAGARVAVRHLKESDAERKRQREVVAKVRARLDAIGIPHLANPSHIIPVMVGDPVKCKMLSDILLDGYGIYVQPINYPTVAKGTERLRITPSPVHTDADIDRLVAALGQLWSQCALSRAVA